MLKFSMNIEERKIKMICQECFTNEILSTWKETLSGSKHPPNKTYKHIHQHHLT